MNVLIKRRQLIMAALIVVLGAAVFVNWYFTNGDKNLGKDNNASGEQSQNLGEAQLVDNKSDTSSSTDAVSAKEYFAQIKLNRENSREDAMNNINAVLDSAQVDSKLAQNVAQSLDKIVAEIDLESSIETLVSAKLGCECVAVSSEKSIQVVVEKGKLNDVAVLQIKDIVLNNSNISAEDITILEAGS